LSQQRQNKSQLRRNKNTHTHNQGCARTKHYTTKHQLMLASTMQISNNNPTNPPHQHTPAQNKGGTTRNNQHRPTHNPPPQPGPSKGPDHSNKLRADTALMLQDPTVCQPSPHQPDPTFHTHTQSKLRTRVVLARPDQSRSSIIDDSTSEHHRCHSHIR
jgi:hypothetical protein